MLRSILVLQKVERLSGRLGPSPEQKNGVRSLGYVLIPENLPNLFLKSVHFELWWIAKIFLTFIDAFLWALRLISSQNTYCPKFGSWNGYMTLPSLFNWNWSCKALATEWFQALYKSSTHHPEFFLPFLCAHLHRVLALMTLLLKRRTQPLFTC